MLSVTCINPIKVCCRTQGMVYFDECLTWLWKSHALLPWPKFFIKVNQTHRVYGGGEFFHVLPDSLNSCSSKHWRKNYWTSECKCEFQFPPSVLSVCLKIWCLAHTSQTILSPEWLALVNWHYYAHCEPSYFLFGNLHSSGISQSSFLLLHQLLVAFYLISVLLCLKQIAL